MTEVIGFDSYFPHWSPDGTRIAVSVRQGEAGSYTARVLIAPVRGGEPDTITPLWMVAVDSDWSPDGTMLVVTVADAVRDVSHLWLVPIKGGDPTQLTADSTQDFSVAWSPDGDLIAYSSRRGDDDLDLHVVSRDGLEHRQLTTTTDANEWFPTWSPDSKWIAFDSDRSGDQEIWAIPARGGDPVRITNHPSYDGRPSWSPDGKKIAFLSLRNGGYDIWTIDVEMLMAD